MEDVYSLLDARQTGRTRSRGRRLATGAIVGIAIACVAFLVFCLLCCWFCCCRKKKSKGAAAAPPPQGAPAGPGSGAYKHGGFLSKFGLKMPGSNNPNMYQQNGHHPGMQEAGYGQGYNNPGPTAGPGYGDPYQPNPGYGQPNAYGYSNAGPQAPAPAYR